MHAKERMTSGARVVEAMLNDREKYQVEREERTERRRARAFSREDARWRAIDAKDQAEVDRNERMQADPIDAKDQAEVDRNERMQ